MMNSKRSTHSVGAKKANGWGLHDMHGNLMEWCADYYDPNYYLSTPAQDPKGPDRGGSRVARGGSWYNSEFHCRSAFRTAFLPDFRFYFIGFRIVVEVQDR